MTSSVAHNITIYTFSVPGQPAPAPRLSTGTKYIARRSSRYYAYKDAVRAALIDAYPADGAIAYNLATCGKPFVFAPHHGGALARVSFRLYLAHATTGACRHGDPDNICKALLDALFDDDRHVLPCCTGLTCGSPNPRVEIAVQLLAGQGREEVV